MEKEKAAGLLGVTDGEFRRSYWHLDFFWGFDGVERVQMDRGYLFHGEETRRDSARLSGKLRFGDHPFLRHFAFLKEAAGEECGRRQCIPSPAQFYAELVRGVNERAVEASIPTARRCTGTSSRRTGCHAGAIRAGLPKHSAG